MSLRLFLRPARWLAPALAAAALVGCGGGLYLGYGDNLETDRPPEVSLAVSPDTASRGQSVRLVAAASDDFGIDRVDFYRVDGALATLIASDRTPPYQVDTAVPSSAGGSQTYYARAVDDVGQGRDSALVSVAVLP